MRLSLALLIEWLFRRYFDFSVHRRNALWHKSGRKTRKLLIRRFAVTISSWKVKLVNVKLQYGSILFIYCGVICIEFSLIRLLITQISSLWSSLWHFILSDKTAVKKNQIKQTYQVSSVRANWLSGWFHLSFHNTILIPLDKNRRLKKSNKYGGSQNFQYLLYKRKRSRENEQLLSWHLFYRILLILKWISLLTFSFIQKLILNPCLLLMEKIYLLHYLYRSLSFILFLFIKQCEIRFSRVSVNHPGFGNACISGSKIDSPAMRQICLRVRTAKISRGSVKGEIRSSSVSIFFSAGVCDVDKVQVNISLGNSILALQPDLKLTFARIDWSAPLNKLNSVPEIFEGSQTYLEFQTKSGICLSFRCAEFSFRNILSWEDTRIIFRMLRYSLTVYQTGDAGNTAGIPNRSPFFASDDLSVVLEAIDSADFQIGIFMKCHTDQEKSISIDNSKKKALVKTTETIKSYKSGEKQTAERFTSLDDLYPRVSKPAFFTGTSLTYTSLSPALSTPVTPLTPEQKDKEETICEITHMINNFFIVDSGFKIVLSARDFELLHDFIITIVDETEKSLKEGFLSSQGVKSKISCFLYDEETFTISKVNFMIENFFLALSPLSNAHAAASIIAMHTRSIQVSWYTGVSAELVIENYRCLLSAQTWNSEHTYYNTGNVYGVENNDDTVVSSAIGIRADGEKQNRLNLVHIVSCCSGAPLDSNCYRHFGSLLKMAVNESENDTLKSTGKWVFEIALQRDNNNRYMMSCSMDATQIVLPHHSTYDLDLVTRAFTLPEQCYLKLGTELNEIVALLKPSRERDRVSEQQPKIQLSLKTECISCIVATETAKGSGSVCTVLTSKVEANVSSCSEIESIDANCNDVMLFTGLVEPRYIRVGHGSFSVSLISFPSHDSMQTVDLNKHTIVLASRNICSPKDESDDIRTEIPSVVEISYSDLSLHPLLQTESTISINVRFGGDKTSEISLKLSEPLEFNLSVIDITYLLLSVEKFIVSGPTYWKEQTHSVNTEAETQQWKEFEKELDLIGKQICPDWEGGSLPRVRAGMEQNVTESVQKIKLKIEIARTSVLLISHEEVSPMIRFSVEELKLQRSSVEDSLFLKDICIQVYDNWDRKQFEFFISKINLELIRSANDLYIRPSHNMSMNVSPSVMRAVLEVANEFSFDTIWKVRTFVCCRSPKNIAVENNQHELIRQMIRHQSIVGYERHMKVNVHGCHENASGCHIRQLPSYLRSIDNLWLQNNTSHSVMVQRNVREGSWSAILPNTEVLLSNRGEMVNVQIPAFPAAGRHIYIQMLKYYNEENENILSVHYRENDRRIEINPPLTLVSKINQKLHVAFLSSENPDNDYVCVLNAKKKLPVPIHISQNCCSLILRCDSICSLWTNSFCFLKQESTGIIFTAVSANRTFMCAIQRTGRFIYFFEPLRVHNNLPFTVSVTIQQDNPLREVSQAIRPRKKFSTTAIDINGSFIIQLGSHGETVSGLESKVIKVNLSSDQEVNINVQRKQIQLIVSIVSPYWLINLTSSPLIYCGLDTEHESVIRKPETLLKPALAFSREDQTTLRLGTIEGAIDVYSHSHTKFQVKRLNSSAWSRIYSFALNGREISEGVHTLGNILPNRIDNFVALGSYSVRQDCKVVQHTTDQNTLVIIFKPRECVLNCCDFDIQVKQHVSGDCSMRTLKPKQLVEFEWEYSNRAKHFVFRKVELLHSKLESLWSEAIAGPDATIFPIFTRKSSASLGRYLPEDVTLEILQFRIELLNGITLYIIEPANESLAPLTISNSLPLPIFVSQYGGDVLRVAVSPGSWTNFALSKGSTFLRLWVRHINWIMDITNDLGQSADEPELLVELDVKVPANLRVEFPVSFLSRQASRRTDKNSDIGGEGIQHHFSKKFERSDYVLDCFIQVKVSGPKTYISLHGYAHYQGNQIPKPLSNPQHYVTFIMWSVRNLVLQQRLKDRYVPARTYSFKLDELTIKLMGSLQEQSTADVVIVISDIVILGNEKKINQVEPVLLTSPPKLHSASTVLGVTQTQPPRFVRFHLTVADIDVFVREGDKYRGILKRTKDRFSSKNEPEYSTPIESKASHRPVVLNDMFSCESLNSQRNRCSVVSRLLMQKSYLNIPPCLLALSSTEIRSPEPSFKCSPILELHIRIPVQYIQTYEPLCIGDDHPTLTATIMNHIMLTENEILQPPIDPFQLPPIPLLSKEKNKTISNSSLILKSVQEHSTYLKSFHDRLLSNHIASTNPLLCIAKDVVCGSLRHLISTALPIQTNKIFLSQYSDSSTFSLPYQIEDMRRMRNVVPRVIDKISLSLEPLTIDLNYTWLTTTGETLIQTYISNSSKNSTMPEEIGNNRRKELTFAIRPLPYNSEGIFFHRIILHPLALRLSINRLLKVISFSGAELHWTLLERECQTLSLAQIIAICRDHYLSQLLHQWYQLVLSFDLVGRPISRLRKIWNEVRKSLNTIVPGGTESTEIPAWTPITPQECIPVLVQALLFYLKGNSQQDCFVVHRRRSSGLAPSEVNFFKNCTLESG